MNVLQNNTIFRAKVNCHQLSYPVMVRPRSFKKEAIMNSSWRYLIIDGYVDEPASLGVPPYLSPQVRSLAGGLISGGAREEEIGYLTVDQWRIHRGKGGRLRDLGGLESLILVAGCVVPGKYLGGTPISPRESEELMKEAEASLKVVTGSAAAPLNHDDVEVHGSDPGVLGYSLAAEGLCSDRKRTREEWSLHLEKGAFIAKLHPDHPSPLICEIETSRGCPRYISGGCSFCMEPRRGEVEYRLPEEVVEEVKELGSNGVENIRIGGQSDLISYMSPEVGRSEVPEPDPSSLFELMKGVRKALYQRTGVEKAISSGSRPEIDTGIIHTDNANPAVIADHPESSGKALEAIAEGATGGSVLALGLESADPEVKRLNNLNSTPDQVIKTVAIINEAGGDCSENGMPRLLPGINFLGGLPGQGEESFRFDLDLLKAILKSGLLLRRINIRRAILPDFIQRKTDRNESGKFESAFRRFKEEVRSVIDREFLSRMLPAGHVIRGVRTEAIEGKVIFGRQIGSYPILVGIPHIVPIGNKVDVAVTRVSCRSVTGFRTPFDLSRASFNDLTALPGIGKKRAASLFRAIGRGEGIPRGLFEDNKWVEEHLRI
jgi:radical SAM superfamily enzyme with C-terminal helix-hairpin-helix motif